LTESGKFPSPQRGPIVAIDGPTGAGKSTVARALAQALGFTCLNTGAMYRAVALAALRARIDSAAPEAEARLESLLASITIAFNDDHLMLNGEDVTARLSDPAIGDLASQLSALAIVRARMRELQRAAGARGAIVIEGRDIGTVIFPDAEFKFYLDAELAARAERRYQELIQKGVSTTFAEVREQLEARDRRDQQRALAPLKPAADAIVIDSTHEQVPQVVAHLKRFIVTRRAHN
jgi:cytidylate kinase